MIKYETILLLIEKDPLNLCMNSDISMEAIASLQIQKLGFIVNFSQIFIIT